MVELNLARVDHFVIHMNLPPSLPPWDGPCLPIEPVPHPVKANCRQPLTSIIDMSSDRGVGYLGR